jgi:tetratricopeptide (TPR) repeat protein
VTENIENIDINKVDQAIKHINNKNIDPALELLFQVIKNTPSDYSIISENDGDLTIKFWDIEHFKHFIDYNINVLKVNRTIIWVGNAYPRALYYIGYCFFEKGKFDESIKFLQQGYDMEPTNSCFIMELSRAFIKNNEFSKALNMINKIDEINQFITKSDFARALRTKGFIFIDLQDFDKAEYYYKESLKYDPENEIAIDEINNIRNIKLNQIHEKNKIGIGGFYLDNIFIYDDKNMIEINEFDSIHIYRDEKTYQCTSIKFYEESWDLIISVKNQLIYKIIISCNPINENTYLKIKNYLF